MNILQIFPGKIWGGAEQYILDLGKALSDRGNNVRYICRPSSAVISRLENEVEYSIMPLSGPLALFPSQEIVKMIAWADLIHIHDVSHCKYILNACRTVVCPKIILTRHIARKSKANYFDKLALKKVNHLIFVSNLSKNLFVEVNKFLSPDKCHIVRNSIPTHNFTENEQDLRFRFGIEPHTPVLMFTGRIRKSKGCAVIIEALSLIKDLPWAMIFVGNCKPSDYDRHLTSMALKSGIGNRVFFTGFSKSVRALINQADIGLAPSIVKEACPLSPMEFMQAGKCVITSDNGAQPEYITDRVTGFLTPPDSPAKLADILKETLSDSVIRQKAGNNARIYFEKEMNYDSFISKILSIYNS